ncbi:MAG TPA: hypothetical protein VN666_17920 [Nitrospira sp.]|nr:hypothetical protein [Nitrospira sp.]
MTEQNRAQVLQRALTATHGYVDNLTRAQVLAALVPYMTEQSRELEIHNALIQARYNELSSHEASELKSLAPHQPEAVLVAAQAIKDKDEWFKIFTALAQHRPEAVLAAALAIKDGEDRTRVLTVLLPHVAEPDRAPVLQEALTTAQAIADYEQRAMRLIALLPHVAKSDRPPLLKKALVAAQAFENSTSRAEVLTTLVPLVAEQDRAPIVQEALAATLEIENIYRRASDLEALAPYPSDALLAAAQTIEESKCRAQVLAALVPHVGEQDRNSLIDMTLNIFHTNDSSYMDRDILTALAPYRPDATLAAARALNSNWERGSVLAALASYSLSGSQHRLYHLWRTILRHSSTSTRSDLMVNVIVLMPILKKLGKTRALEATFLSVRDVTTWWP